MFCVTSRLPSVLLGRSGAARGGPGERGSTPLWIPLVLFAQVATRAGDVPTAATVLGFDPVADGSVVDTADVTRYCRAVDAASDRLKLLPFGLSTEGRPLWLVLVSAPENILGWREARRRGETVFVLVTCGMHPDEVGSTAAFFPLVHRLVTASDSRHRELLRQVIIVIVPTVNPDGTERVATWLRSEGRAATSLPVLYHRYSDHDLNRDWLLATQAETRALIRRVHHRFLPWVTIDVHQMGRIGPRLFVPPYAEPLDPSIPWDIRAHVEALGDRVFEALAGDGRQGVVRRWVYDAWTPARGYPFYHGGLRFLLEAASADYSYPCVVNETDVWIAGSGNHRTVDHPEPWPGGTWDLSRITDLLVESTLTTLFALLEEPLRSGQQTHFSRIVREDDGVLLDGRGGDPGVAHALLRQLALTGNRITAGAAPSTWIVRDPPWGAGWCRSLLLCTPYPTVPTAQSSFPRRGFNATPYDTATHDVAHLAGLRAERWTAPGRSADAARADRAEALRASLEGTLPPVASLVPTAGRLRALPRGEDRNAGRWLLTGNCITTVKHLPDLIEAGVGIRRVTAAVRLEALEASPGDFILDGVRREWIEQLVGEGADAIELDSTALEALDRSGRTVEMRYPCVWVLEGALPSIDEGWLRWVLESYRFRFQRITIGDLLIDRDFGRSVSASASGATEGASPGAWGRDVLLIAEGTLRRSLPRLKKVLEQLIERGGRVIALGRAARWTARTCELPVVEVLQETSALPGTILRTDVVAPAGYADPILWGYRHAPGVFYHLGPLWAPRPAPRGEDAALQAEDAASLAAVDLEVVLRTDPERPLVCGLLRAPEAEQIVESLPLVRLQLPETGGEWILCGFRPHFRGWTLGTFRLLFNMILAP